MSAPVSPRRRASSPRSRQRAFTLIEVMMALTVLLIGVMGVVALERATIVTNVDARQMTTGTSIARLWLERLQSDAALWNHPSSVRIDSDLADTFFLKNVNTGWFRPSALIGTAKYSYAFDINGNDLDSTTAAADSTVYCANVRLTTISTDPLCSAGGCAGTTPALLRAEVRVYWKKSRSAFADTEPCAGDTPAGGGTDPIGGNEDRFHFVYEVGAVGKVVAQ
ncbi:MAG: prepilin-type N-terminal cleavage/methylation domain-containing protein [Polyangiales bacterium]